MDSEGKTLAKGLSEYVNTLIKRKTQTLENALDIKNIQIKKLRKENLCKARNLRSHRKCARKFSKTFRKIEGDIFNLVPSVGEINEKRSNYEFAEIPGEERKFGKCDFEIRKRN